MGDRAVEVIVVPYDVERDDTGAARAPAALLERGFLAGLAESGWKVHETEIAPRRAGAAKADVVADLGLGIARAVAIAHSRKRFPLVLAGGCLCAVGVVTGLQRMGRELEIVWIDAHGDFNTPESTPSGYWDGMALAAVCGRSLREVYKSVELRPIHFRSVVHLAGRAFDPPEVEDFRRLNLKLVPPELVASPETHRLLTREAGEKTQRGLYLHVDVDGLDPGDAPAVNYPAPGGPALAAVLGCFELLPVPAAMTLSALNFERVGEEEARRTVATCLRLVNAFGDGAKRPA
ncbi:MAG TPA: arginase family protein [Thermoanaerobaculia bacterium]|nr:arginase family protein [Thermoanaerobaculia bacterium]